MAFLLIVFGILFLVAGAKGNLQALGTQLQKDFTGSGNFLVWIAAIVALGSLGYSETLRPLSRALMTLVIITMVIWAYKQNGQGNIFAQLAAALQSPTANPATAGSPSSPIVGTANVAPGIGLQFNSDVPNPGAYSSLPATLGTLGGNIFNFFH